ncbi:serine/threonine-protein phosphatase 7 long form [Cinnamomum micranthum f. kanehirae]|uniref:Serine/threonine-protein phosphatase 7 long form n=1 Tax=Cinnamomum micranthum f. kanehirae TaxID=337451 RepID=A0A3S4NZZ0_9MAGN|nr:serine/threonine-protein phosphatase 7 long form [Cinnamomum micranthum f. kanehirae]
MVGLHNVASTAEMKIQHGIIWALVERWRPKTNTFHFNFGEATITMEDVAYIYGLPIDGRLVTESYNFEGRRDESIMLVIIRDSSQPIFGLHGGTNKVKMVSSPFWQMSRGGI